MIHAAKQPPQRFVGDFFCEMYDRWGDRNWCLSGPGVPETSLPLGAAVAVADIVDCLPIIGEFERVEKAWQPHIARAKGYGELCHWAGRTLYDNPTSGRPTWVINHIDDQLPYGDWTVGRWAYQLANVRLLAEPVPCKGAPGVWNPDQATINAVVEQLRARV